MYKKKKKIFLFIDIYSVYMYTELQFDLICLIDFNLRKNESSVGELMFM